MTSERISDNNLPDSSDLEVIALLMDVFVMSEDELSAYAEFDVALWVSDIGTRKYEVGQKIAEALGYPSSLFCHQQPYDLVKMFPLSLSEDVYDEVDSFELAVWLFSLWSNRVLDHAASSDLNTAMARIRAMNILLAHYFGDDIPLIRSIYLRDSLFWTEYFRNTHGCFDLERGVLIDRLTPLMRELRAGRGYL